MSFEKYQIESKELAKKIKREGTTYAKRVVVIQGLIMAVACEVEHGTTENLTNLIHAFSNTEGEFKLTSESKQMGQYIKGHLPIKWDVKEASFKIDEKRAEGFDYDKAVTEMENTVWNTYKIERPAQAFDADKKFGAAIGILKNIVKHAEIEHDVKLDNASYKKAKSILKSVGEQAA